MPIQHPDGKFDPEVCKEKHRSIGVKFGWLLILMATGATIVAGAVGGSVIYSRDAEATAQQAIYNCEILSARNQEFRSNLEKQLERQDALMMKISAKQDQMNDTLNRLAAREK